MTRIAYIGADIFDGTLLHKDRALLTESGAFIGITEETELAENFHVHRLNGGTILPGFVDLQLNGGGGVMFNDETTVEGLSVIAEAHRRTGTRALLPTLITDTPERTQAAITAVEAAIAANVPGIIGLHLEGPHLSEARKGAHDPNLIRPMNAEDEAYICKAAGRIPNLKITVAPETVTPDQIARLTAAGVIVSLGHSDCDYDTATAAIDAGATCVTHLFNAMSPLNSREPGLVGATLSSGAVSTGLIADGIHVHPAAMRTALAAKQGPGRIFLVTDAMATVGSEITEFTLNGRRVFRREGSLRLENGTLAGADLELGRAINVLVEESGINLETALAMATSAPASFLHTPGDYGHFRPDCPLNAIYRSQAGTIEALPDEPAT